MNKELHFTKKDFKIDWFNGSGNGGQGRNKLANCCRITHIESGLSAVGQRHKSRVQNQKEAFNVLASRLIQFYSDDVQKDVNDSVIRNYHAVRNEVHDKASGLKMAYKDVVEKPNLGPMIEARKLNNTLD